MEDAASLEEASAQQYAFDYMLMEVVRAVRPFAAYKQMSSEVGKSYHRLAAYGMKADDTKQLLAVALLLSYLAVVLMIDYSLVNVGVSMDMFGSFETFAWDV